MAQTFSERVYAAVRRVPRGSVTTYGHIALLLDVPGRARQVGQALRELSPRLAWDIARSEAEAAGARATNGDHEVLAVPWHRVVNARGRVSPRGDGGSVDRQVALLRREGLAVTDDGVLKDGLEAVGWFPEAGHLAVDHPASGVLFDAG